MEHIVADYFTQYVKAAVGAAATLAMPDTINSDINDANALPDNYLVSSNYPNPFNANTVINFNLPSKSSTRVSVYDVLGREVEVLLEDNLNAGKHKVRWQADDYSSGIYFYRIKTDYDLLTKRMILLK